LSDKTSSTFKVTVTNDPAEALKAICGETPGAALLDGRAALAAIVQNCGTLAFKMKDKDDNFGVKADIIVRVLGTDKNPLQAPRDLRGRDFCRLSGDDLTSWVLPSLTLRTSGVNPAGDLKGVKEFPNAEAMVQGLADGVCAATGIPSGTLSKFSVKLTGGQLRVITSTAELPYGGIVVSPLLPKAITETLIDQIRRNPERFSDLLGDYQLVEAKSTDYDDFIRFAQNAGLNLRAIGQ
jgi:ABC-type phosphate/phosphonate transport system substrate-binding protein